MTKAMAVRPTHALVPRPQFYGAVGARVAAVRSDRRLTLDAVVQQTSVSQSSLSRLEHGDGCSSLYTVYLLAMGLQLSLDWLCATQQLPPAAEVEVDLDRLRPPGVHQLVRDFAALPPSAQEAVLNLVADLRALSMTPVHHVSEDQEAQFLALMGHRESRYLRFGPRPRQERN